MRFLEGTLIDTLEDQQVNKRFHAHPEVFNGRELEEHTGIK